jgi:hypothetical protein
VSHVVGCSRCVCRNVSQCESKHAAGLYLIAAAAGTVPPAKLCAVRHRMCCHSVETVRLILLILTLSDILGLHLALRCYLIMSRLSCETRSDDFVILLHSVQSGRCNSVHRYSGRTRSNCRSCPQLQMDNGRTMCIHAANRPRASM